MYWTTKNRLVNKRKQAKQQIQATPTHVKYALHQGKENVTHNVTDFKQSMADTKAQRKQQRMNQQEQKRKNIAQKRLELDKAKEKDEKKTHHLLFRITSSMFASVSKPSRLFCHKTLNVKIISDH